MSAGRAKNVVYIAENALSEIQGGGIVAYAVLKGIAPEQILGFYDYENITPVPQLAHRFILLKRWRCLDSLQFIQPRIYELLGKVHGWLKLPAMLYFFLTNNIWLALNFALLARRDFHAVKGHVERSRFQPEVVYFSGLSLRYLRLAVDVSRHYDIPMVLLHMDNWMGREKSQVGRLMGGYWFRQIVKHMTIAAGRSLARTTNSPGLAKVVSDLTGYEHKPANNCCTDLMKYASAAPSPGNPVPVITYVGSLNPNLQGKTLVIVSHAVAELNAEGIKVRLDIYTPWEFAPIANQIQVPNAVCYRGQAGQRELADIYLKSDFLLATTTFDSEELTLFRHSLSTKLSEYLCVGKPVISVGHASWHLHEYVQEHGCGFSIYDSEVAAIKAHLRRILATTPEELSRVGRKNRLLWESAHDVEVMSRDTRAAIGLPV